MSRSIRTAEALNALINKGFLTIPELTNANSVDGQITRARSIDETAFVPFVRSYEGVHYCTVDTSKFFIVFGTHEIYLIAINEPEVLAIVKELLDLV